MVRAVSDNNDEGEKRLVFKIREHDTKVALVSVLMLGSAGALGWSAGKTNWKSEGQRWLHFGASTLGVVGLGALTYQALCGHDEKNLKTR